MSAIVSYDRWYWRSTSTVIGCCRLETWRDKDGGYHVLVTERADNPGPSIFQDHGTLRRVIENWLEIPPGLSYSWWEQFNEESYRPARDAKWVSRVKVEPNGDRRNIPPDEWDAIYYAPRRPEPVVKRRRKELEK